MLKSSLFGYSGAWILVKGIITVTGAGNMIIKLEQMKEIKHI